MPAAAFQRIRPERRLPVDMDENVVTGIVKKTEQLAHLSGTGVHEQEIGMSGGIHITKIRFFSE